MCTYLARRGATYYFRRPIPAELRPLLGGRLEWISTLRTKDREAAKRMIPPLRTIETDKEIEKASKRLAKETVRASNGGTSQPLIIEPDWEAEAL